jgi:hypothetical protein
MDTRAGAGALTGGRKVYPAQAVSGRPVRGGACCTARRTAGNTHEWGPWRTGGQEGRVETCSVRLFAIGLSPRPLSSL